MVGVRASKVVGIERKQMVDDGVDVAATEAGAEAIYVEDGSAAAVLMTSGALTEATIYAGKNKDDTFFPLGDSSGTVLTVPLSASQWNCLPVEIFNVGWIKLVGSGAAVVTIQKKK